jgi:hypothetical protein
MIIEFFYFTELSNITAFKSCLLILSFVKSNILKLEKIETNKKPIFYKIFFGAFSNSYWCSTNAYFHRIVRRSPKVLLCFNNKHNSSAHSINLTSVNSIVHRLAKKPMSTILILSFRMQILHTRNLITISS